MEPIVIDRQPLSRRELLKRAAAGSAGILLVGRWLPIASGEDPAPPALRDGKQLIVHTLEPLNAEPRIDRLVESWITPVERFYVRTHGTTPVLDARSFRLSVEGEVERPLSLSMEDLAAFPRETLVATLTCAGNRRSEHSAIKPVAGVPWGAGAIGNARWEGVRLADVLARAGVRPAARHVWFESQDAVKKADGTMFAFGASVPIEKVESDRPRGAGVLLAHTMNEKPLPVDHGFPLRAIVPGYIGARSVKWLSKIVVSDRPSPNFFVQDVYKIVATEDLAEARGKSPIYEYPINAAIGRPAASPAVSTPTLKVAGYALPPGTAGRTIARVELSADRGRSWQEAKLLSPAQEFAWQLWEAEISVPPGETTLRVRAVDSAGAVQPETTEWNAKGYLYGGWHAVTFKRE